MPSHNINDMKQFCAKYINENFINKVKHYSPRLAKKLT